ncbi:MAG: hypothetical protein SGPRY_000383 [Prymnesium sp.]
MTPQARLVVLIGSRQQVSNAAHVISLLLHPPSSHPPVLQLEAVSIVKSHYPLLNDFSFSSWPPEGTRVSQRIKGLLASADNVRHDLLVEASLVSRIIGPRGNIQKTLQQQTGCVIILPGKAGHQEDARPRDRTILLHENAALEQISPKDRCLLVARRTRERKLEGLCQHCWLRKPFCCCASIRSLGSLRSSKVDVHIAVHYKEYGRATATAKLLPLLAPDVVQLHPYPEVRSSYGD